MIPSILASSASESEAVMNTIASKTKKNILLIVTLLFALSSVFVFTGHSEALAKAKSKKTLSKEAFKIQNSYRKEKGVSSLIWSEEAYKFAKYRIKKSGYDHHKHIQRDAKAFFGNYYYTDLNGIICENLAYTGSKSTAKKIMKLWKKSKGHYSNLLLSEHLCGAIATDGHTWCAVFFNISAKSIDGFREKNESLIPVTIKIYDTSTDSYVTDSIRYYDISDKDGTMKSTRIRKEEGLTIYLEKGKKYVVFNSSIPNTSTNIRRIEINPAEIEPGTVFELRR